MAYSVLMNVNNGYILEKGACLIKHLPALSISGRLISVEVVLKEVFLKISGGNTG